MPQLDGVEALRRIMDQDKNAKVIMVSSVGHKEMVWKAICLGAKSFVTKPFSPEYAGLVIHRCDQRQSGGMTCDTIISILLSARRCASWTDRARAPPGGET